MRFRSYPVPVQILSVLSLAVLHPSLALRAADEDFAPVRLMQPVAPITDAPFRSVDEVQDRIPDEDLVIGVEINGEARAYPVNMLTGPRREIINDQLGGRSIAATW